MFTPDSGTPQLHIPPYIIMCCITKCPVNEYNAQHQHSASALLLFHKLCWITSKKISFHNLLM